MNIEAIPKKEYTRDGLLEQGIEIASLFEGSERAKFAQALAARWNTLQFQAVISDPHAEWMIDNNCVPSSGIPIPNEVVKWANEFRVKLGLPMIDAMRVENGSVVMSERQ